MSRFWPAGIPIRVQCDAAAMPCQINWNQRWHTIHQIVESWRIDEQWWHRRAWRDYFKVLTTTGLLLLIYYDRLGQEWRLQRLYD
jgi:hypothetical protein